MEDCQVVDKKYDLNFMVNKISVPKMVMTYWLSLPEFVEIISKCINEHKEIDDKLVYGITKEIYFQKALMRENGNSDKLFNYKTARRGLNGLSEKVLGSRDGWRQEYQKFKEKQ